MIDIRPLDDDILMSLVELTLARPSEDRESYLRSVCDDAQLFSAVWDYVQSEDRMRGFLLDPIFSLTRSENPFAPDELVDGRFRIIREVGRGGMGVVYEAFDEKLDRRIAVKCARTGYRKWLSPEVRLARDVSSPFVCRIFEIHTASTAHGEIDFITMEFLDGATLDQRLDQAALPRQEARVIGRQLAAGLAEAHRNGVIHGDLKSNNVFLTKAADGSVRSVITDFGLARQPDVAGSVLQSSQGGGTPDYMAPELWKGQKASTASDVFALGVILFELVAGKRPYPSGISWEERLKWTPEAVDPPWDGILCCCLDPDPEKRFHDASDVAQALAPARSKWWLAGSAAAALLLATVSGAVTYQRATAPKESVRLALLPFVSEQDTKALASRAWGDTAVLLDRLKGTKKTGYQFVRVPVDKIGQADSVDKAQSILGATEVMQGTLRKTKAGTSLHVWMTDTRSHATTREWSAIYDADELRFLATALAGIVTETLHLNPLETPSAVKPAAARDYATGASYTRQNSTIDSALALLNKAVAEDPESPLTHIALAEAQLLKYSISKDKSWLQLTADSIQRAEKRNPDVAALHRVAGLLLSKRALNEMAAAQYQRAIELDPKNSDGYRRLGSALEEMNRRDEALAAYKRAVELEPDYFKTHQDLGLLYYISGDYPEAITQMKLAVRLAPDEADTHFALGTTYLDSGNYAKARMELVESLRLAELPKTLINLGQVLMYAGNEAEAAERFARALRLSKQPSPLLWINAGNALRRLNKHAQSHQAYLRGLEVAERELSETPTSGILRSNLAYLCARLGQRTRAESEIAQALFQASKDADTLWFAAVTYEALQLREQTLKVLSSAPPGVLEDLKHWPDVAELHADPGFENLLAASKSK